MFAKKIALGMSCAILAASAGGYAIAQNGNSVLKSGKAPGLPLPKKVPNNAEQYGGVVVDLTTTGFGRQFYQRFVAVWQDSPLSDQYAIAIRERATARFGSQIVIEYAQRRVYQTFLPPSNNAIRLAGENAPAIVLENIMAVDVQRLMFRDEDLGVDEI